MTGERLDDNWRERFLISVAWRMPAPDKYPDNAKTGKRPLLDYGELLKFNTFEEAVAEKRWRLNNLDKWLPKGAIDPDLSDIQRQVYSTVPGAAPYQQRNDR